jgi:hypothetical protein
MIESNAGVNLRKTHEEEKERRAGRKRGREGML